MFLKLAIAFLIILQLKTTNGYICYNKKLVTQSPVIGVLSQEVWNNGDEAKQSFIVAGYVKYLEMAGAQVVPILLKQNDSYYDTLFQKINGVLFPGGAYNTSSLYTKIANKFLSKATNNNVNLSYSSPKAKDKTFFPIWGTCLGFEVIMDFISGDNVSYLSECKAYDIQNNVHLTRSNEVLKSDTKLFKDASTETLNLLRYHNITVNYHRKCLTIDDLVKHNLNKNIRVLGLNKDKQDITYVSIIESKYYPIYGVQFHPEMVLFEFKDKFAHRNIPHSLEATKVSQYFANFFVQEARKNKNCFNSQDELNKYLIYNYNPEFTALTPLENYVQKYFFDLN